MGAASIVLYVVMNYISAGIGIADSVSALGVMIAFYYGLTGFACCLVLPAHPGPAARNLWSGASCPLLGVGDHVGHRLQPLLHWGPGHSATRGGCRAALGHRRRVPDRPGLARARGGPDARLRRPFRPAFFRGEVLNRHPHPGARGPRGPVGLFGVGEEPEGVRGRCPSRPSSGRAGPSARPARS